jgi:SAM-dependent methyltransferase
VATRFIDSSDPGLRLRCPCCGARLLIDTGHWSCADEACGQEFHLVDAIPVLLNPLRSVFRAEDFVPRASTTFKAAGTAAEKIGRLLPSPSRDVSRRSSYRRLAAEIRANPEQSRRILVIGSGDGSASYHELAEVDGAVILETDVSLAGTAKVVCDASDLPFDDGQFDLVISHAVLEHVLEPQRCVDEIHRVLRPRGLVYATTPFMQQVHMGEYDFTRFTHSGHRWLFRHFDEVESGIATGPASVLVWSVEYFLLAWTTTVWLRRIFKASTRILLGWMTWLDYPLSAKRSAFDGSGGFYFVGRRRDALALSPHEMIGYYRGADSVK